MSIDGGGGYKYFNSAKLAKTGVTGNISHKAAKNDLKTIEGAVIPYKEFSAVAIKAADRLARTIASS
jgi:hypothetical protein